jgi:hypothetical protein
VARGGEEDEEKQGTVNAGAVEEVGCQEEEGEVEWGERERKREEQEGNVAGKARGQLKARQTIEAKVSTADG